jgi:hypothetical protein
MGAKPSDTLTVTMPTEREIVVARRFDAPGRLVFFQAMAKAKP